LRRRELCEFTGELAEIGAGVDELGRRVGGDVECGEDLVATTGRRGRHVSICVWLALVRSETGRPPSVIEDVLRQVEPASGFWMGSVVGGQLVGGVDAQEPDAGEFAHALGGDALV
jgi:hypothetical protein